jgi:membrane-bound inhibitor of C-type lysozyme
MRSRRLAIAALVNALAAACSGEPETATGTPPPMAAISVPATGTTSPIAYACESGESVVVRYRDTATAQIAYKGRSHAMRLVPSGSGARYSGSGVEWWVASRGDQERATLSRLGPSEDVGVAVLERCDRPVSTPGQPAADTPGEAAPSGVQPASAPCRVAQLRLSNDAGDAGAGNRGQIFAVTNTGAAPCSVAGYPFVSLLDAQGRALTAVRADQNPSVAAPVSIPANGKAYFDIAWTVVPDASAGERICPSATRVRVLIPGETATLATPLTLSPCGGRIRVNPFRATSEPAVTPPTATPPTTT